MMKVIRMLALITVVILVFTGCANKTESKLPADTGIKTEVKQPDKQPDQPNGNLQSTPSPDTSKQSAAPAKPQVTSQTTVSSPAPAPVKIKAKVVVIDPGHANRSNLETEPIAPGSTIMKIKDGGGAQGVTTKTPEYLINMEVALKLKTLLEQKGFSVVMTKTDNSVSLGNVERAEIGNRANANLVIRIHADSSDISTVMGASMLVPQAINDNTRAIYDESKRCGQIVLNTLINQVGMKNRGLVARDDMTGFNWSTVPVILVEMGFLSNSDEDQLLSSTAYQDKLAKGLADGIAVALK